MYLLSVFDSLIVGFVVFTIGLTSLPLGFRNLMLSANVFRHELDYIVGMRGAKRERASAHGPRGSALQALRR